MKKAFKVGERVRVVKSIHFPEIVGRDVTIDGPLELIRSDQGKTWFGYSTDYRSNEKHFAPPPHFLEKKRPGDGPAAEDSTKVDSSKKVGQPSIKQPERATS